ncbi:hypothetical protein QQS21_003174 [Conoideocrella luteorostrata]|uniref:Cytochrome b5 heme-binding domain-containing protein n=1 Tax=Conoideocrella luteorostrata TaxID=1105319 RepID=A0AAJ0CU00_9HYPO|nr:hypothetical protein QQS21_003174 [Conoideocrella luteorostrata]
MDQLELGNLGQVPRFRDLLSTLPKSPGRSCYAAVYEVMNNLGRAIKLTQHRRLINDLNSTLGFETLEAITSISLTNTEVCAAFGVYFTALEQAFHWPRDTASSTPEMLENHKLVIQILNQPQLREKLCYLLEIESRVGKVAKFPKTVAQTALTMARSILQEAQLARQSGRPLPGNIQDTVNLLYRTCRSDWFDQGDYNDFDSHKQFGRLHEVIRASGTQRRLQELFEEASAISCLRCMPNLLQGLPSTTEMLQAALAAIQFAVAVVRDELFAVAIDEVIWGRTFANFSKAVGFCNVSAGGADAPIFCFIDTLCGRADANSKVALLEELEFRSRFFPPNVRALVDHLASSPSLRTYLASHDATYELQQSFRGLEQQRYDLYRMHRKKATRITIALRAGQRGTSAGVCARGGTTGVAKHLAGTLRDAMKARFGDDLSALQIDAIAQSHSPLLVGNAQVHAARVIFRFSTPLAIGPGDCLEVTVQLPDGARRTRTYSVTYTYSSQNLPEGNGYQITSAAEVNIRCKGLVSRYLCSQSQGCQVQVAVKPAPHFRLSKNTKPKEQTIFVAQGGSVGLFVAWIERQKQLTGRYVLVVGARRYSELGYKAELRKLAYRCVPSLQIVVALSQPGTDDLSILRSWGAQPYHGWVTGYLSLCSYQNIRTVHICGSSSFGLDTAKSPAFYTDKTTYRERKYGPRLQPITTSTIPTIRLLVAPEPQDTAITPNFPLVSRSDLALHNSPTDLWIAVGSYVYDVTAILRFHPGGEKVLLARAGRQAEDMFKSVHGDSEDVNALLRRTIVGQLAPPDQKNMAWEKWLDRVVEIQNDLTNHSRFEKVPSPSGDNLSECPPSEVVHASVDCFISGWHLLLYEMNIGESEPSQLQLTGTEVRAALDACQATAYEQSFADIARCGFVLHRIFDAHMLLASKIHSFLDKLKSEIATCIINNLDLGFGVFYACTNKCIAAMNELAEDMGSI